MSNFSLMKRGVIQLTSSDTSPKDIALPAAVRSATAKLTYGFKDQRRDVSIQRGTVTVSSGGTSPQDVTITEVGLTCSELKFSVSENRDGNARGVNGKLNSSTQVRFEFYGTVDATENIKIDWEVIEHKPARGVLLRLKDDSTLEASWDGTLVDGETIDIAWNLLDLDDVANSLLELDFKALRALGYLGENQIVDLVTREFGQQSTYRIRIFDSKANAEAVAADEDLLNVPDGSDFATGEIARVSRSIEIDIKNNDRDSMLRVLSKLADTPGIEE